jgi:hypothetical protein
MTKLLKIRVRQRDFARKHTYRKDYSKNYSLSTPEIRAVYSPTRSPVDIAFELYNIQESDIDRITRLVDTIEYNSFNPELYNLFLERSIPPEYLFSMRETTNKIGVSVWRIEDKLNTVADTIFPPESYWRRPRMEVITSQFRQYSCPNFVLLINDERLLKYVNESRKTFEEFCQNKSIDFYSIDNKAFDELKLNQVYPDLLNSAFFRNSISNREDIRIPKDVFIFIRRKIIPTPDNIDYLVLHSVREDAPGGEKDQRYRIYINDRMLIERYFPYDIDSSSWMLEETVAIADLNDTVNIQIRSDNNLIISTIKLDNVTHEVMDMNYQLYI